jgi:hypothetical protein
MKRITFGEFDVSRIYEWRLALKQGMGEGCCDGCALIEKRLRDFLGKKDAMFIQKMVNKNPYFIKGKRRIYKKIKYLTNQL